MLQLTAMGWVHTICSLIALGCGIWLLLREGEIRPERQIGKLFLATTAITALTALAIHERTAFGPGHVLAVLALGAILFGLVVGKGAAVGSWRHVLAALAFSFTLLCQLIPGAGETLTRLPLGNPVVTSFDDPLLGRVFLGLLIGFAALALTQLVLLRRRATKA